MDWSAIKYVTSGLTLAAFAIAAVTWLFARGMARAQEVIETAPSGDRLRAAALALERFQVDVSAIKDDEQKVKLALEQLYERRRRLIVVAVAVVIVAVVGLAFTAFALAQKGSPRSPETNSSRPPLSKEVSGAIVPDPDGPWVCWIAEDTHSDAGSLHCGTDTKAWGESRTWTLHIKPPDFPTNRRRLKAGVKPTSGLGIAILPLLKNPDRLGSCRAEQTLYKRQTASAMTLSECEQNSEDGRFDRYEVRVVVCGPGGPTGASEPSRSTLADARLKDLVTISVNAGEEDPKPVPLTCEPKPRSTATGEADSSPPSDSPKSPTKAGAVETISPHPICTKQTGGPTWFYLRLFSVSPSGWDKVPMPEEVSPAEGVSIWDSPPDVRHPASVAGICLASAVSRASRKLWLEANVFGHTGVKREVPDWLNYIDARKPFELKLTREGWHEPSDPKLARLSAADRIKAEEAIVNAALAGKSSEVVLARLIRYVDARPGVLGRYIALRFCGAAKCTDPATLPRGLQKWVNDHEASIRAEEERESLVKIASRGGGDPKQKSIVIAYLRDPSTRAHLGVNNKQKQAARAYIEKQLPAGSADILLPLVNDGFDIYIRKLPHGENWRPTDNGRDIEAPILDGDRNLPR
jgi:hypothetical protein